VVGLGGAFSTIPIASNGYITLVNRLFFFTPKISANSHRGCPRQSIRTAITFICNDVRRLRFVI